MQQEIPVGLCQCGCGEETPIATHNLKARGYVKGEPLAYYNGHGRRTTGPGPNPSGLCQCGCGELTPIADSSSRASQRVRGTHIRFIDGHQSRVHARVGGEGNRRRSREAIAEDPATGCWTWPTSTSPARPRITDKNGRLRMAYRVIYEEQVGAIPEGHHLHHTCGNKRCVNPDHLEPMTHQAHSRLHRALFNPRQAHAHHDE